MGCDGRVLLVQPTVMKLLVVIPSYRARNLTFECLKSLENEVAENPGIKVGICDNGNEDDTAEFLNQAITENNWQDWAYVLSVMPNRGFSGGNNVILNDALNSEYNFFLLLNADTIVRPGAIGELVRSIEVDDKIGIACPRLEWPDGEPQVSCFRYISPVSEFLDSAKTSP
jgi:N-acetylglucosaminyl-diphospho-decaprenol L-rhamnosyltransferase